MNGRATLEVRRQLRAMAHRLPDLFGSGATLVVGFSGGQDSTCLLHALGELGGERHIVAAHVDHALRAESAREAERIAELAGAIADRVEIVRVDVAAYRQQLPAWSVQQAARAARYQALARTAAQCGARAVLVAHTLDDQAETVLLNLLRGAGLGGLAGMPVDETVALAHLGPRLADADGVPSRVRVARPLLRVARPMTLAYCSEQELTVVEDASNQSRGYTRNRVRLDLLPMLEDFNPAVRELLARTADLVGEDLASLNAIVKVLHAELELPSSTDAVLQYDLAGWRAQPRGIQRRLLRRGLEELLGDLVDVPAAPIDDALELLRSGRGDQTYHLPYGVELYVGRETFELRLHGSARQRKVHKTWEQDRPRV